MGPLFPVMISVCSLRVEPFLRQHPALSPAREEQENRQMHSEGTIYQAVYGLEDGRIVVGSGLVVTPTGVVCMGHSGNDDSSNANTARHWREYLFLKYWTCHTTDWALFEP